MLEFTVFRGIILKNVDAFERSSSDITNILGKDTENDDDKTENKKQTSAVIFWFLSFTLEDPVQEHTPL